MERVVIASGLSGEMEAAGRTSRSAAVARGTFVPADRRELGDFNFVLLAVLASGVASWVLIALMVYWLI